MTKSAAVSLVIVSRHRPKELKLLLVSLPFLTYPNFEVIVVGPNDPRADFPDVKQVQAIKYVAFDRANISAARNIGIAAAAGDVIAFCDDDSVPEPTWLTHLVGPFSDPLVGAAGGYVRGRNGISFQWQARCFDRYGTHSDLRLAGTKPELFQGDARRGIKTEGTNCAFRRDVLVSLGGFDENFHYFMDETDMNYRFGLAGWKTAIVPLAQVHHGFAASGTRSKNRAPRDLFEIGASMVYFLRKHGGSIDPEIQIVRLIEKQRIRVLEFMVRGDLEPFAVKRLMSTLRNGVTAGAARVITGAFKHLGPSNAAFKTFKSARAAPASMALAGRPYYWRKMAKRAAKMAAKGDNVTLFRLSFTSFFHHTAFHPNGYWEHTGGVYGRSARKDRIFTLTSLQKRAALERRKLADIRPMKQLVIMGRKSAF